MINTHFVSSTLSSLRLVALEPYAGEPVGQVSNSHGSVKVVGVLDNELVPDSLFAGAERTTV